MVVTVHAADRGMTRGEMAKLLVEGAGLSGQAAEYAAKTSAFRDVAEGSAYEGYINPVSYTHLSFVVGSDHPDGCPIL